jgi:FAD:protein FMN transferase
VFWQRLLFSPVVVAALTVVFPLLSAAASGGIEKNPVWVSHDWVAMTTAVRVEYLAPATVDPAIVTNAVVAEFRRIEALMSNYQQGSEVSELNRYAAKFPVKVSDELIGLLKIANRVSELTAGAFDITYASVGRFYDYRRKIAPAEVQIAEYLSAINYQYVIINDPHHTVFFTHPHVYIDLGGIAKGYAVDRAVAILKQYDVTEGMVSAGGDSRLIGNKAGKPWIVGIRDPRGAESGISKVHARQEWAQLTQKKPNQQQWDEPASNQASKSARRKKLPDQQENIVVLPLAETAVSTSGDYERYFIQNGERIHHIISPRSGKSAKGIQSVTIIGPDATTTDALSTAVFVLGTEQGLTLVNKMAGIDAIIVDAEHRLHYSSDLQQVH